MFTLKFLLFFWSNRVSCTCGGQCELMLLLISDHRIQFQNIAKVPKVQKLIKIKVMLQRLWRLWTRLCNITFEQRLCCIYRKSFTRSEKPVLFLTYQVVMNGGRDICSNSKTIVRFLLYFSDSYQKSTSCLYYSKVLTMTIVMTILYYCFSNDTLYSAGHKFRFVEINVMELVFSTGIAPTEKKGIWRGKKVVSCWVYTRIER